MDRRGTDIYIGIFLISTAALMFEIALTRVLSVAFWHHFAFLVISTALFGIAASGTYLTLKPSNRELKDSLSLYAMLFSISAVGSYTIINLIPFDPFRFFLDKTHILLILLYYLLLATPFFFFGLCIAISFAKKPGDSGKIYFSNLTGSGIGAIGVLGLFKPLGGFRVLVFSALIGLTSAFIFSKKRKLFNGIVLLILLALLLIPSSTVEINMSPYKPLKLALLYPNSKLISTEWNSISRVDVLESGFVRYAPGLSLTYQEPLPKQIGIAVDGTGLSAITEFNGTPLKFTRYLTSATPYTLNTTENALIIEPGGGLEIIEALSNNVSSITTLESNPLIIEILLELQDFTSIYKDSRVKVIEADARSFLELNRNKYDIIVIGLSSSSPVSSTGVYALTENYLFTVEAFKDYLDHLSEDGILSVTRRLEPPPRESLRTISIALQAHEELDTKAPEKHIATLRSLGTITILIKKSPFTPTEIERIKNFATTRRFDLVYLPGLNTSDVNLYNKFTIDPYHNTLTRLIKEDSRPDFYESYLFDVKPTWDKNPFFFQFFRLDKVFETYDTVGGKWQIFLEGGFILYLLLIQATILCFIFIMLPLSRHIAGKAHRPKNLGCLTYFFAIGLGFMFIEISLIQRFILYLGKPVYAISTVLFSLLVFSGLGSLYVSKWPPTLDRLKLVLSLLVITILIYLFFIPLFSSIKVTDIKVRYLITILALAPLGFLMGMPLPTGIRLIERIDIKLIPWSWAVNGSASVLGSIAAVIIALNSGFPQVIALASATYALSLVAAIITFAPLQQVEQIEHL
jgi:hypothetical protein